jgi:hypothetical protein
MQTQAQETEVVQGTIVGIIQKGPDKWQVAVKSDPNSQYDRKLWTKDQALINQLSTMIGSQQAFMCGISHWTNAQGAPVKSLWINGVGPQVMQGQQGVGYAAQGQQQWGTQPDQMQTVGQVMQQQNMQPQQQAQPQQQQSYEDPRQAMIHRQTASKVAVHLMAFLPAETPRDYNTFMALCQRLVRYYDHGTGGEHQPQQDNGYSSSYYGDDGQGDPDGDIPF